MTENELYARSARLRRELYELQDACHRLTRSCLETNEMLNDPLKGREEDFLLLREQTDRCTHTVLDLCKRLEEVAASLVLVPPTFP